MELSKRLQAVADLVTPGNRLADVGTDHGYIPIFLVEEEKIPHGIAMDVNRGPLLRAREHIGEKQLEEQIETRLSDGMKMLLPGEADTVVIAGMGGALTIKILQEGINLLPTLKELILQPQSELAKVRCWLAEHGLRIADEDMVLEEGKYYPMMRVVPEGFAERGCLTGETRSEENSSEEEQKATACAQAKMQQEMEMLYGPLLLKKRHPVLREYLLWEQGVKESILEQLEETSGEGAVRRREEVRQALELNRKALRRMEN